MARSAVPGCLLACLLAFSICQGAVGHGFLQVPRSRNYIANRQGREYCHHCLSSGGPWVVQTNTPGGLFPRPTETVASSVRHTMCGEAVTTPASQRLYNPSPVPSLASLPVYAPGAEFDMTVQITAHHRGHFEFRLCDASKLSDPTTVTWACLDQHVLQRVSVAGEVSPVDVNHPERYYLEPECAPGYNKTIVMRYRMPAAVTCERCVLQWWWVTANSCNPPDYQTRSPQPAHVASGCQWWQSNLPVCSTAYPEEFWNCADVRIAGAAAPPQPAIGNTEPAKPAAPQPVAPTTQTTAPAPAPASTPALVAPAQPVGAGCAKLGWQCGGAGWAGPTCCEQGSCMAYIPDYSDCRTSCPPGWLCNQQQTTPPAQPVVPPTAPPAAPAPKASPVAPKAPPVAPKAPPAAPKAPPAVPKAPPAVPKAPPAVPKAPPSGTQGGCAGLGYQCGGSGWTGSTCCSVGQCYAYISTYSQCRIDACPPGWLCNTEKSLMTQAVDWVTSLASL